MGNFENFRLQVERAAVVLARQKAAGFLVQITGKQEAKAAIRESENNRVPVNRVRRRQACESFFSQFHRGMSYARSFERHAEKSQPAHVAALGYGGAENVDLQLAVIEEAESVTVAEFKPPKRHSAAGTVFFQCGFPPAKRLVQLIVRNLQQIIDKPCDENFLADLLGWTEQISIGNGFISLCGRPLHQPVVVHALWVNEDALELVVVGL